MNGLNEPSIPCLYNGSCNECVARAYLMAASCQPFCYDGLYPLLL